MKVKSAGRVVIDANGPIGISGFIFEPETDEERNADPATSRSLQAEAATNWALKKLNSVVEQYKTELLRKVLKGQKPA